ncbi:MAG: L,D-transpeptidase family protein [Anaerolineae bacterium]|nr:L,D-transpeptidase family protein [Anaerolineae bacterium]
MPAAPSRARPPRKSRRWLWWGIVTPLVGLPVLAALTLALVMLGMLLLLGGRVYPQVAVGGVPVGGLTEAEAVAALRNGWDTLILRDGGRSWSVAAGELGVTLDAPASAARAYAEGRSQGMWLSGVAGAANLAPVVVVDAARAEAALDELAGRFAEPAVNAGVRIVNGQVQPTAPREGRELDLRATVSRLMAPGALDRGELPLVMQPVAPTVTDASPLIAAAEQLLSQSLDVRLYDPVTGDSVHWTLPPEQWGAWLEATPGDGPGGLTFTLNSQAAREYLTTQAGAALDPTRYLEVNEIVTALQAGVAAGAPRAEARVYHHDREHVVQAGETLISIAWDYGVPYPWIQQANGGIEGVGVGQAITIPSPDNFMEFPVVPDKRIVLSISRQHAWVYENGQLKWDWVISTGIADSPTWPGIYQIISHVPNAYAANWNLYMPNFLGVYRPIPGADFTNGFHGFPTRGSSQLLWTNSLGTRVTYGCILLSNQNAQALYNWAENGVVVEIQP